MEFKLWIYVAWQWNIWGSKWFTASFLTHLFAHGDTIHFKNTCKSVDIHESKITLEAHWKEFAAIWLLFFSFCSSSLKHALNKYIQMFFFYQEPVRIVHCWSWHRHLVYTTQSVVYLFELTNYDKKNAYAYIPDKCTNSISILFFFDKL